MLNVGGLIDSAVRCNNNKTPDILAMRCCVTPLLSKLFTLNNGATH